MSKTLSALRSCASIQHGRHIDTMPIEPPIPMNEQPLVATSERPIQREIYQCEKKLIKLIRELNLSLEQETTASCPKRLST
jgi:hypothetical protein